MAKPTELSRAERKAKKRALEDAIPDLPGDDVAGEDELDGGKRESKKRKRDRDADADGMIGEEKEKKKTKKEKKSKGSKDDGDGGVSLAGDEELAEEEKKSKKEKKDKKDKSPKEDAVPKSADMDVVMADGAEAPKKSKKERKAERRAAEAAAAAAGTTDASNSSKSKSTKETKTETNGAAAVAAKTEKEDGDGEKKAKKNNRNREKKRKGDAKGGADAGAEADNGEERNHRFIVFVGNLPFTANKDSIRKHFASVQPKSIRPMTEKSQPTVCKGSAFVEFDGYDHMKTCLKLFHHSEFNDGLSAPRKINVELTVGGGGNTKARKAKIVERNEKLNEERVRRMQEEEKAKLTKIAEGGKPKSKAVDESAVHPSRRRFVPGAVVAAA